MCHANDVVPIGTNEKIQLLRVGFFGSGTRVLAAGEDFSLRFGEQAPRLFRSNANLILTLIDAKLIFPTISFPKFLSISLPV